MQEEEAIAAGIKQAVRRGESLEKAKQTFLNAGYSKELVERAARVASGEKPSLASVPTRTPRTPAHTSGSVQPSVSPAPHSKLSPQPFREFKPLAKPIYEYRKPKRTGIITWIIAILIIILAFLVNGFLIWKFILK